MNTLEVRALTIKTAWVGAVVTDHDACHRGQPLLSADSIDRKCFKGSKIKTVCPWKGETSYYTLIINGTRNEDATWHHRTPRQAAAKVKRYIAFWRGVEVTE